MPLIQVSMIEEVFTPEQKKQIIRKLTDAMIEVEGEAMRGVTVVTLQEVRSGDWGIGGQSLTTADVKGPRGRRESRMTTAGLALICR